ncbi:hypothetical protein ACO0LC_28170 [Undibacterium sp. JH2W]|uniref:hypothetical protein n=1 Tax=Undibacterium sp. JH2W TaxID=3413037 RepID=UPI003BF311E2
MSKIDIKIIRKLLENGRAQDLLSLMNGESKYSSESSENLPSSKEEVNTYWMAIEHVTFVLKYGFNIKKVQDGTQFYSACPDYFEKWLTDGCPGIVNNDLNNYLKDNPI